MACPGGCFRRQDSGMLSGWCGASEEGGSSYTGCTGTLGSKVIASPVAKGSSRRRSGHDTGRAEQLDVWGCGKFGTTCDEAERTWTRH